MSSSFRIIVRQYWRWCMYIIRSMKPRDSKIIESSETIKSNSSHVYPFRPKFITKVRLEQFFHFASWFSQFSQGHISFENFSDIFDFTSVNIVIREWSLWKKLEKQTWRISKVHDLEFCNSELSLIQTGNETKCLLYVSQYSDPDTLTFWPYVTHLKARSFSGIKIVRQI